MWKNLCEWLGRAVSLLRSGVVDEKDQLSAPKLAALTGYAVIGATFIHSQWNGNYNESMWIIYIGATVLHSGYDRTVDVIRALKEGKSAGQQPPEGTDK